MMRIVTIGCVLALTACGGKDGSETGSGTGNTVPVGCTGTVTAFPATGSNDAYYRTTIEFTMSGTNDSGAALPDGSETIAVSSGGAAVDGTVAIVDDRVVFTPSSPLAPSTTYDATLTWCNASPTTSSFTTSDVGSAVDAASLIGNTYALNLADGRFVEPAGVGALIGGLLDVEVMLGVTAADASILHVLGALGDGNGNQDMCTESFDFPVDADFTANPYFIVESDSLDLDIQGVAVSIEDLEVSGAFSPNGDQIAGAVLKGTLDVNILADLVGDDPCALLVTFGVACQECSDGSGAHCLSVNVDSMTADQVAGLTLTPRSCLDIDNDTMCTATPTGTCPP